MLLKPSRAVFLLATAGALLAAPAVDAQQRGSDKTIYCWEEEGERICGDALPADAVDNARREFSTSGLLTRTLGRALTEEEKAAAEALAALERENAARQAAQARQEQAMVHAYDSEEALQRAFDARIGLVEASARSSELGVESIRSSLMSLLRQAAEAELAGRAVPKALAAGIQEQHRGLRLQQSLLEQQRIQRQLLGEELEQSLARYRELRQASHR